MKGSGFDDIVVEAGICASGSIEAVLKGKHYNRAIRVHCVKLEALERLLFFSFEQNKRMTKLIQEARDASEEMNSDPLKHDTIIDSDAISHLYAQYCHYKEEIRRGTYGRTPQFWKQYMDKVWILLRFSRAIKTNNLDLYMRSTTLSTDVYNGSPQLCTVPHAILCQLVKPLKLPSWSGRSTS
ncbi:hypothetical protein ElyMa_006065400 [Elysia marginata]|uniref:Uncharacterized protein n=1 Tax=Elysia marginata TaxID=1093978 RepID=A0AAV4GPJ1_9GAST|nr:hypothetical protein ElyMa_006065400 [Elysia marginata]